MKGKDAAEQFNQELDDFISGARPGSLGSDPLAMKTAEKLFRADFSGDSRIRESLRARLVAGCGGGAPCGLARLFGHNAYARAAFAAVCVLLVVVPLMRVNTGRRGGEPKIHLTEQRFPQKQAVPVRFEESGAGTIAEPERGWLSDQSIFSAIPMSPPSGERLQAFPIETKKGQFPIALHEGRKVEFSGGAGVVWETEDAVFTLEIRATSVEELFERKRQTGGTV